MTSGDRGLPRSKANIGVQERSDGVVHGVAISQQREHAKS